MKKTDVWRGVGCPNCQEEDIYEVLDFPGDGTWVCKKCGGWWPNSNALLRRKKAQLIAEKNERLIEERLKNGRAV